METARAIRVIRRRGSKTATLTGGLYYFSSLQEIAKWTKKQHKVVAFCLGDGRQGIMRSGRLMRWCDLHVRNAAPCFKIQQLELFGESFMVPDRGLIG